MKNPFIHLAVALLRLYKVTLSPVFSVFGIKCRYSPSCSSYSIDAFQRHGVWRGFWLTLARLLRCHPWGSSGIDPVPECAHNHPFWAPWRHGDWNWGKTRGMSHDISCENEPAHKGKAKNKAK